MLRSRILVVFDSEVLEIGVEKVCQLDRKVRQITRAWARGEAKLFVKRVYGGPEEEQVMTALGVKAGWRQGGTGEEEDILPYLWSDCKSFCLEQPRSTMLVLCSDRPELKGPIRKLGTEGVDTRVITPAKRERSELASMVRMDSGYVAQNGVTVWDKPRRSLV